MSDYLISNVLKKEIATLAEQKGAYKSSIKVLQDQVSVYQLKVAELNKVEDAILIASAEVEELTKTKDELAVDIFKKTKELKALREEIKEDRASIQYDRDKYLNEKELLKKELGKLRLETKKKAK